jgi:regulator of replication initiation timing
VIYTWCIYSDKQPLDEEPTTREPLPAVEIRTFEDILRALRSHPRWPEELRRLILTDELLILPQKFDEFVQKEFRPLKQKVERIEGEVGGLKQDVAELKSDVAQLKTEAAQLKIEVEQLKIDVADLKGDNFERKVREKAPAYFGRLIKESRVISPEALADLLDEATEQHRITDEERDDTLLTDIVLTGLLRDRLQNAGHSGRGLYEGGQRGCGKGA